MNEPAGHADCADVGSGKEVRRKSARARESRREPLISADLPSVLKRLQNQGERTAEQGHPVAGLGSLLLSLV
jgi:hypothetical protein